MRGDQRLEVPLEKRHNDRHGVTGVTKPTRSTVDQSFGKLDEIVKRAMEQTSVPGISVAIIFDDLVLYQNGYGVRSTGTKEPVQAETVFQIASLSKPVSATIMAGLVGVAVIGFSGRFNDTHELIPRFSADLAVASP